MPITNLSIIHPLDTRLLKMMSTLFTIDSFCSERTSAPNRSAFGIFFAPTAAGAVKAVARRMVDFRTGQPASRIGFGRRRMTGNRWKQLLPVDRLRTGTGRHTVWVLYHVRRQNVSMRFVIINFWPVFSLVPRFLSSFRPSIVFVSFTGAAQQCWQVRLVIFFGMLVCV